MSKLKRLSGREVIKIFTSLGFKLASQKGSHVKLSRVLSDGDKQVLIIPNHKELDKGTLQAIYRQAGRYLREQDLKSFFYTKS